MTRITASSFFAIDWTFKMQKLGFLSDGRERLLNGLRQNLHSVLRKIQSSPLSDAEKQAARQQAEKDAAKLEKRLDGELNLY